MKKLTTVSIGIPAYNEEQNIGSLLQSVLQQKQRGFVIDTITVVSDRSTDKTKEIVQVLSEKHLIIKLLQGQARKGKYFRVNQLFRDCQSDILFILDADIALVGDDFLEKMVKAMHDNPQAKMVSAHNILLRPNDFVGKVIHTNFALWDSIRLCMPNYDSAANFYGSATAYRGSFARSLFIPASLSDPHLYIYLAARKLDGFAYCREAEVLQYSLTTISDLRKFLNRSIGKRDKVLERRFGVKLEEVYYFPLRYKLMGLLKTGFRYPFYLPLAIMLSLYLAKSMPAGKVNKSPIWESNVSSKKAFAISPESKMIL